MSNQYFRESDLPQNEIQAGIDAGELLPWRIDCAGEQWFRQLPATIKAIPADRVRNIEGEDGDDD